MTGLEELAAKIRLQNAAGSLLEAAESALPFLDLIARYGWFEARDLANKIRAAIRTARGDDDQKKRL